MQLNNNIHPPKPVQKILAILVILSLIAIFLLRIYAIYNTVAIRTWDDVNYRRYALEEGTPDINLMTAIEGVFWPNSRILDETRSIGYHAWLVLALKLYLSGNSEQTFQLANLGLLVIQAIVLFYFCYWATKSRLFSGTLTFIYLSSPIVFGINRWVMTENFVMTGLLIFGFIPVWILKYDRRPFYRQEFLLGISTAWMMGIYGSLREYAAPSYIVTSIGTVLALGWLKRWDALWGFAFIFVVFFSTLLGGWLKLIRFTGFRVNQTEYFHPLNQWIFHCLVNVIGIPLSIIFGLIIILIAWKIRIKSRNSINIKNMLDIGYLKNNITALQIIWIANGIPLIFYSLSILISDSRQARAGILIMFPLLNFILISIKVFEVPSDIFRHKRIQLLSIFLILTSWSITYYDLLIAFNGGKTFAHPAYGLEYYNHPLYLRPLQSPEDMHTHF